VNLNEVIRDAVKFTQPKWHGLALAEGRQITIDLDLAAEIVVQGRPTELREMLTNLICNAVDAMPSGGTITCGVHRHASHVVIEIVDQGQGMPPEVRERCMEPLFTTKGDAGTGLGLSIVSAIVQRHDGKLEIQSSPGAGTRVRIELPTGAAVEKAPVEAMAA
jgi:signal transduction histidine kinase